MAEVVEGDHTTQENVDDVEVNEAENLAKLDNAMPSSKSVITVRLHPASTVRRVLMRGPDILLSVNYVPIVGPVVEVEEEELLSGSDQAYSKFCEILSLTPMCPSFRDMVARRAISDARALILRSWQSEIIWRLHFPSVIWVDLGTEEVRMVPASDSAIEALEGGTLRDMVPENRWDELSCTVCMEELDAECLVTPLPCKHVFHSQCISQWLKVSHYCPLCRFQIP